MGLEVFDFIPDLVPSNPEPTDPVAQGDDHLRGIKFTLQNQWPLIGQDAVTRTALQMNDAALRSESNVFTANLNEFQNTALRITATTNAENGRLLYIDETSVQRWNVGRSSTIGGGLGQFQINRLDSAGVLQDTPLFIDPNSGAITFSTTTTSLGAFRAPGLAAATPSYAFTLNTDMGMYRVGNDLLGFSTVGAERLRLEAAQTTIRQKILNVDGAVGAPGYSFSNDPTLGIYRPSAGVLAFSTGGSERLRITTNIQPSVVIRGTDGSDAAPAYSFNNFVSTGLNATTGSLNIVADAQLILAASVNDVFIGAGLSFAGDGTRIATRPSFNFGNDSDTGLFRPFANAVSLVAGGVDRFRVQTTSILPSVSFNQIRGTTALPAYTFDAQSNCGMSLPVNNELTFSAGASRQFVVRNNTVAMPLLPTSVAGLVSGDCWRNPVSPGFVAIV